MGNRAVLEFEGTGGMGIYLHWNGGRDTIEPLLAVAREYKLREDSEETIYGYSIARITQMLGNFFGDTLSLGVGLLETLDCDNRDNGTYIISKDLQIVGRKYFSEERKEQREYDFEEMKKEIKKNNDQFFLKGGVQNEK